MKFDIAKCLSWLREDSCTVYRNINATVNNITRQKRVEVLTNVPCSLYISSDIPDGESAAKLVTVYRAYFEPDVGIQAGDELHFVKDGKSYVLYAGEPSTYINSHTELMVQEEKYV